VGPAGSTFFWSFALFVLLAPLYKAGNRALPLLLLEFAAIAFLLVLALRYRGASLRALPSTLRIALALMLVYPLLQLVPLPHGLWRVLPGHVEYATVLDGFAAPDLAGAARAISIVPAATEYGWLALLPPLACLVVVPVLAPAQVVRLLTAMAVVAGMEGLVGLLQVGGGGDSPFRLRETQALGAATGTFVNRDHLATLLAMMLPVLVGLLAYDLRRRRHGHAGPGESGANAISQRVLVFGSALIVLLCLVFTYSRAGIATALVGLACSSILLVRTRSGHARGNLIVGALIVLGVVLAGLIGLAPVLERFGPAELRLSGEGRFALYAATLRAAIEFLPFGSGLSTFADVFPRFQLGVFGGYIDYAHNDYLQLLMELGLVGVVVIALLLFTYALRMGGLLQRRDGRSFTILQLAAGIALLPPLLHAMFDFGLHMPANAIWFATLAGVLLHPGVSDGPGAVPGKPARGPETGRGGVPAQGFDA
jgi:O-antigen ligase